MKKIVYHLKAASFDALLPSQRRIEADADYIKTGDVITFYNDDDYLNRYEVVRREVGIRPNYYSQPLPFILIYLFVKTASYDWMETSEAYNVIKKLSEDKDINTATRFENYPHKGKDLNYYKCLSMKIYERLRDFTSFPQQRCIEMILYELDMIYNIGLHE